MDEVVYTTCTLDCPDGCGILAHVRDGRVVRLEGHPEHPITRGFLCPKTYRYPERVHSSERVLSPLVRSNGRIDGEWKRVGWDEALDTIASKIRDVVDTLGPLAILAYQRTGSWGATKLLSRRFWNLLGGVTMPTGSLCSGAARAGQAMDFGARIGHDPLDLLESRLIFVWGRNPVASGIHVVALLREARRRGARVVVVDPIRSQTVAFADRHVQPRPGSDAHLAMAMAKVLLEEDLYDHGFVQECASGFEAYRAFLERYSLEALCRVADLPESEVREVARLYAGTKPAAILLGWGLNKYRHSAEIFRCVDALGALAGNIGVPGGGVTHGYATQRHFDKAVEAPERARFHRTIPEPELGRGIAAASDPPIRMMFVNGGNPVNQSPSSGRVAAALAALDFVVTVDTFLTDTSDYAHVFLPTTTFLEEEDVLVSWGHNIIGGVNPAIPPVGEARSDLWIFQALARRLGFGDEMAGTPRQWLTRIFAPLEAAGVSVEQVMRAPVRCPVAPMVPFKDRRFSTKSGKFEFITAMDYEERVLPDFPLTLVTNFTKKWLLSQILSDEHPSIASVRVSPATATAHGLGPNDRAIVRSPAGRLEVMIVVDDAIRNGMVVMPVGTWIKRRGGANVLTEDIVSNFGQMAAFFETRVALEPSMPAAPAAR